MFIETPNTQELRQGDILTDIYFPIMPCRVPKILSTLEQTAEGIGNATNLSPLIEKSGSFDCYPAQVLLLKTPAILLSQCCDVEFSNRGGNIKRRYLVVAPLTEVPPDLRKNRETFESLSQNPLDRNLNYFYIPESPPLTTDYIADFTRIVSIPAAEATFVLGRKILQMTDEMRVRLKVKFSTFFGRPSEGEEALIADLLAKELGDVPD
jgi:hypothetical protein